MLGRLISCCGKGTWGLRHDATQGGRAGGRRGQGGSASSLCNASSSSGPTPGLGHMRFHPICGNSGERKEEPPVGPVRETRVALWHLGVEVVCVPPSDGLQSTAKASDADGSRADHSASDQLLHQLLLCGRQAEAAGDIAQARS